MPDPFYASVNATSDAKLHASNLLRKLIIMLFPKNRLCTGALCAIRRDMTIGVRPLCGAGSYVPRSAGVEIIRIAKVNIPRLTIVLFVMLTGTFGSSRSPLIQVPLTLPRSIRNSDS
jgi:hypothetical protein